MPLLKKLTQGLEKASPLQKIFLLMGILTLYFAVLALLPYLLPLLPAPAPARPPSLPKKSTPPSKYIIEKPEPPPFLVDAQEFPVSLNPSLFFQEIEHGSPYIEQDSYRNMLHKIATMTQEELLQEALKQESEERITYEHTLHAPKESTGRFVRFCGEIVLLRERLYVTSNSLGIEEMWEGQLWDGNFNIISFHLIDPPLNFYENYDHACIVGLFFKMWVYTTSQKEARLSPLIIGRKLTKLPQSH
jgi:hypothetical protein